MDFIDSFERQPQRRCIAIGSGPCEWQAWGPAPGADGPRTRHSAGRMSAPGQSARCGQSHLTGEQQTGAADRLGDVRRLRATAPLADGPEAPDVAGRILATAGQLPQVDISIQGGDWRWCWRGRLGTSVRLPGAVQLRAGSLDLTIGTRRVIAVSLCESAIERGVRLYDEAGPFLTLGIKQSAAFDDWLEEALRECV